MSTRLADSVAAEVRAELARQHISGRQLARLLGEPYSKVGRWTKGDDPLDINELERIGSVIGVSVPDLLLRATAQEAPPTTQSRHMQPYLTVRLPAVMYPFGRSTRPVLVAA